MNNFDAPSTASSQLPAISGILHGGNQPVSGATVQLYAANTATAMGASTALLATTVATQSDGTFTITGDYTCPTPSTLVYLVGTGGNPGLPGTVNNNALALMTLIGTCNTLTSSTFLFVNELTTVAAVEALAPFMTDYVHVGAASSNTAGLPGAFNSAAAIVNFQTGTFVAASTGITPPTSLYNSLADILAACVNSQGGTAGDTSNCGKLLGYAGSGGWPDSIAAMLAIVRSPSANIATLFSLISASGNPFQPALAVAPASFASIASIALPNLNAYSYLLTYRIAIDTAQHIWVYNPGFGSTGTLTVYDNTGKLLFTIPAGSGGLSYPFQLKPDSLGNMWVLNNDQNGFLTTVSKFSSTGAALSPSGGYSLPAETVPVTDVGATNNVGQDTYMTFDSSGRLFVLAGSIGCYLEFTSDGALIPGSDPMYPGYYCPEQLYSDGLSANGLVTDGSDNLYLLTSSTSGGYAHPAVLKLNSSGSLLSPTSGYAGGGLSATTSALYMTYDHAQDQLWFLTAQGVVASIKSDGTAVSPATGGFSLPYPSIQSASAIETDGAGNLWFITTPGSANSQYVTSLNEYDPSGNILTPNSGYPSGIVIAGNPHSSAVGSGPLAIDGSGNVWFIENGARSFSLLL